MLKSVVPPVLLCIAIAIGAILCLPSKSSLHHETSVEAQNRFGRKLEPNDHLSLMRAYPDLYPDYAAFEHALETAREQDLESGRRSSVAGITAPWRLEGPVNIAGRVNTVAVHPNDPGTLYAGSAAGGIFRTQDGGTQWHPVFDAMSHLAIGHIAIDPQNPAVIYAGTGDRNVPGNMFYGNGVWKSTDGGTTWTHLGLEEQGVVSKIIVHPSDPQTVFVATLGHPAVRNTERGLYKTTDGGDSWAQMLFISDSAGVTDLVMHPVNPDMLYAAAWNRLRTATESMVSGEDAGVYQTIDGGETWNQLTNGLPDEPMGRIALAISTSNPDMVLARYVNTSSDFGGIYRTVDGGASWSRFADGLLPSDCMSGFGWYFGYIGLNPWDDHDLWVLAVELWHTPDNGASWGLGAPEWWRYEVHADKHDIQFLSRDTLLLATDGGVYRTDDAGSNWQFVSPFPNIQFYRIAVNPHVPGEYWGGAQDNGTMKGSHSDIAGWTRVFGGDGFQPVFHPYDPSIIYVMTQNGRIWVSNDGGGFFDSGTFGIMPDDRRNWDMPLIMSHSASFLQHTMYTGTYRVYRNVCGDFPCWEVMSPDLTDGIVHGARYHTISALAESAFDITILYAGTSDANVWCSTDAGENWINVSAGLPDRYVTSLCASRHDPGTVWVTHSGYRSNDHFPRIHMSTNYGQDWTPVHGDLPPLAVNKVIAYPDNEQVLFAATDGGVYITLDGGGHWERLGVHMPFVPVFDLAFDHVMRRLVAGTFARSMMSFPLDSLDLDPTSISSIPNGNGISLHVSPNPAVDMIHVSLRNTVADHGMLILSSTSGAQVGQWTLRGSEMSLDLNEVQSGLYILTWSDGKTRVSTRFVKI